jgi:hypothetical protein
MDTTRQETLMQRWHVVQYELLPELRHEIELTPKLECLIHTPLLFIPFSPIGCPSFIDYDPLCYSLCASLPGGNRGK